MITIDRIMNLNTVNIDAMWADTLDQIELMYPDAEGERERILTEVVTAAAIGLPWLLSSATHDQHGVFNISLGRIVDGVWINELGLFRRIEDPDLYGAGEVVVGLFVDHLKTFGCTGQLLRAPANSRTAQIMFASFNSMVPAIYATVDITETDDHPNGMAMVECRTTFAE